MEEHHHQQQQQLQCTRDCTALFPLSMVTRRTGSTKHDLRIIANDIKDVAKKRANMPNGVGLSTYRLIETLCLPRSPKAFKFEELLERVRMYFNPKLSVIVKRFEFNTRKKRVEEPVSEFVAC